MMNIIVIIYVQLVAFWTYPTKV